MPIYNFECPVCKKVFAELVKLKEIPPCKFCDNKKTKKILSGENTGFSLKGKGWYKDGY